MLHRIRNILVCLLLGAVCCGAAWAMDYARMSNQELADLQGAILNAPEPEQQAFRLEWEKRLAVMPEEEKKRYAPPQDQPQEDEEKQSKPRIQGRGYDSQGTGVIIYGGGAFPAQGGGGK
jgi:hypothetical protein